MNIALASCDQRLFVTEKCEICMMHIQTDSLLLLYIASPSSEPSLHPFYKNSRTKEEPKRLLRGTIFLSTEKFCSVALFGSSFLRGAVFSSLNMIMNANLAPLCQRGAVLRHLFPKQLLWGTLFQNSSSGAPFWHHLFCECDAIIGRASTCGRVLGYAERLIVALFFVIVAKIGSFPLIVAEFNRQLLQSSRLDFTIAPNFSHISKGTVNCCMLQSDFGNCCKLHLKSCNCCMLWPRKHNCCVLRHTSILPKTITGYMI